MLIILSKTSALGHYDKTELDSLLPIENILQFIKIKHHKGMIINNKHILYHMP